MMAFAGITTTTDMLPPGAGSWTAGGGAPRVSWHACHNWSPAIDVKACWAAALSGAPLPTGDVGDFLPMDGWTGAVWSERDPDGTLEEQWQRLGDGDGRFLAVRCPAHCALLVVAGDHFGYAQDSGERSAAGSGPAALYAAGRVSEAGWRVELSTDPALEGGGTLALCGSLAEWDEVLPGTTLTWPPLPGGGQLPVPLFNLLTTQKPGE